MSAHPRVIRRIAASCAALVVLVTGAAYYASTDPAPAATSSTCETP